MHLATVTIQKPEEMNFILGQSHFIKTVEDIHEAIVTTIPGAKFGLAFCEASGKCLVRSSGTDPELVRLAEQNALALGAGHSFILFLGEGWYPVNVLNTIKMVPEVCRIFCATANPCEVIVAESAQGRGILGVIDGSSPLGIETEADVTWRKGFLRMIGYKA
jgi:adenosine/AMP kinase